MLSPSCGSAPTGPKASNSPSPGPLHLRIMTNQHLLEAKPAVLEVLEEPSDSFSRWGRTSPSVSGPKLSRGERRSPASLRVRDTQPRRLRCSGQSWNLSGQPPENLPTPPLPRDSENCSSDLQEYVYNQQHGLRALHERGPERAIRFSCAFLVSLLIHLVVLRSR